MLFCLVVSRLFLWCLVLCDVGVGAVLCSLCCIVVCCARLFCFGGALCSLILYYGFLCCLALHVVAKSIGMIFQFEFVLPEIRNASIEQVTS